MAPAPKKPKLLSRITFRLTHEQKAKIEQKCHERGETFSDYITRLVDADSQDHSRYLSQASARNSFLSVMMIGYLFDVLKVPSSDKTEYVTNITQAAHRLFGALPPVPIELQAEISGEKSEMIAEIFEVYERHVELQKDALKAK